MRHEPNQRRGFQLTDSAVALIILSVMAAITVPRLISSPPAKDANALPGKIAPAKQPVVYGGMIKPDPHAGNANTEGAGFVERPSTSPISLSIISKRRTAAPAEPAPGQPTWPPQLTPDTREAASASAQTSTE